MQQLLIQQYMDCKVFVDSDADVRLSRRIYKDTQDDGIDLNVSIDNYLTNIKPSY
jgi:uridine kinase